MKKPAPYYTVSEAAKELGKSSQQIYAMIQRGELTTQPIFGSAVLVTAGSLKKVKKADLEGRTG